jgi:hypothetical protein
MEEEEEGDGEREGERENVYLMCYTQRPRRSKRAPIIKGREHVYMCVCVCVCVS